jgi:hypothetical protein
VLSVSTYVIWMESHNVQYLVIGFFYLV